MLVTGSKSESPTHEPSEYVINVSSGSDVTFISDMPIVCRTKYSLRYGGLRADIYRGLLRLERDGNPGQAFRMANHEATGRFQQTVHFF